MKTVRELAKEAAEAFWVWATCVVGAIFLPFFWVATWVQLLWLLVTYPARRRKNIADKVRRKLTDDA